MSGKTVIVTRSASDGGTLAEALQKRGYCIIHEPMTEVFLLHTERQALRHALSCEPEAVIVTSRHGVRALAVLTELRDPSLLCVGEATANVAHSLGFTRVGAAQGNVQSLIDHILEGYDAGSRFLYASGEHVRADLASLLAAHGMQLQRMVVYEAVASQQLSDTLAEQLRRGQADAITFLSPRTAHIFAGLAAQAGLHHETGRLHAFCLSGSVTEALGSLPWKAIHIARNATLASLAECVDNALLTSG